MVTLAGHREAALAKSPAATVRGTSAELASPDPRTLTDRLHFDLEEGCIWLDTQRVIVLHADWFTELRRDLVEALGVEKARGMLTRLGYAAGCRDGQLAIKLHGRDSVIDLVTSGAQMHAFQGLVAVTPGFVDLDLDARRLHLEFGWKNSVEDRPNLGSAPHVQEAACWMAVGYASGHLSTVLGSPVIVRETECKALGHPVCHCVAKFEHEWDDASDDTKYLQAWSTQPTGVQETDPDAPSGQARADGNVGSAEPIALGRSAAFNCVAQKVERVARTAATVLLLGESGVGKSLLAREIHRRSARAAGPFIELNCASLPESLVESELFGVERGAYTGADASRAGRFERASGGTLFLDEICTLGFTAQGKLLRVLQTGEFERLGGGKTVRCDVRLIAATNENLRRSVQEGRFRLDLFYRLNVFPIDVPPLRDRRDDLPLLVEHFLARYRERYGKPGPVRINPRAYRALLSHSWPGNVRELENVLERAVILMNDSEPLDLHHLFTDPHDLPPDHGLLLDDDGRLVAATLPQTSSTDPGAATTAGPAHDWIKPALRDAHAQGLAGVERQLVMAALDDAQGNVRVAARNLGLTPAQVDYRLKKWGERAY
jgi:two-component system response regulator HydG